MGSVRAAVKYGMKMNPCMRPSVLVLDQDLPLTIAQQEPTACAFCVLDTGPASSPRFFESQRLVHDATSISGSYRSTNEVSRLHMKVLTFLLDAASNPGRQVCDVLGFAPLATCCTH